MILVFKVQMTSVTRIPGSAAMPGLSIRRIRGIPAKLWVGFIIRLLLVLAFELLFDPARALELLVIIGYGSRRSGRVGRELVLAFVLAFALVLPVVTPLRGRLIFSLNITRVVPRVVIMVTLPAKAASTVGNVAPMTFLAPLKGLRLMKIMIPGGFEPPLP